MKLNEYRGSKGKYGEVSGVSEGGVRDEGWGSMENEGK